VVIIATMVIMGSLQKCLFHVLLIDRETDSIKV